MTLLLFTSSFPYGKSETFLENEIPYLAEAFNKVYIVSLNKADNTRQVPPNVTVLDIGTDFEKSYTALKSIKYLSSSTVKIFIQEYQKASPKVESKNEFISYMLRVNYKASLLESILLKYSIPTNAIFYSYWFEEWATILSILKKKQVINAFISRAHGFDLYEERNTNNYIKFRSLQLQEVDNIYPISKDGVSYLRTKYPQYAPKVHLSYLGVHDHGINPFGIAGEKYTLVSCSNVVPVKRVALIAEALRYISFPLKWIHFGDGPLMDDIKKVCESLPANVEVELRGRISNLNLMHFYQQTHVSLFINVSESEGLPVSIMEAISFGMPILATDVGGTSEIVTNKTGILVSADVTPIEIANHISSFNDANKEDVFKFRTAIKAFWAKHYDAQSNYPEFINKILKTNE